MYSQLIKLLKTIFSRSVLR